jgi:ribosomal protein S25
VAVSKQTAQKFDVERFNFRAISELEVRKQYQIKFTNKFAVLENLSDTEDINSVWENVKEYIKISAKDSLCLYE